MCDDSPSDWRSVWLRCWPGLGGETTANPRDAPNSSSAPEDPENLGRMAFLGRAPTVTLHKAHFAWAVGRPIVLQTPTIPGDVSSWEGHLSHSRLRETPLGNVHQLHLVPQLAELLQLADRISLGGEALRLLLLRSLLQFE